jgi:20S proteasome subunit alpha 2
MSLLDGIDTLTYCIYSCCVTLPNQKKTVRKARKSAQAYKKMYGETQPVSQLVKQTASVMQEYTQSGGVRPFGISVLVAGSDGDGTPRLYQVDPSGAYFGWKATAIGKVNTSSSRQVV